LVFEGDTVLFAGTGYGGAVDEEIDASGKLVLPGFVDVHVHAGPLSAGRLFSDASRREPHALGFLQYSAPREGAPPTPSVDADTAARLTLAELLRYGVTSAVEIGGETGVPPEVLMRLAPELGVRLVLGKGFRAFDYVTRPDGTVTYRARPDLGREAFRRATDFATAILERADPFLGAMLFPLQVDTCTPELLRDAHSAASELGIGLQVHAAQGLFEVRSLLERTGLTPIGYLDASGALSERTVLAHGIFLSGHSWLPAHLGDDLDRLAASGAALAHCPLAMARRGVALESFERYRRRGVRIAVGTDTFPRDMVAELRWAMYLSRIQERESALPSAWTAYSAGTDVPADLINRRDLGRLAPGSRADFLIVDLTSHRIGPIFDPLAAWLHAGVGEDVKEVYVGGQIRVRDGIVLRVDRSDLLARQQAEAEAAWKRTGDWDYKDRGALELASETAERLWDGRRTS